MERTMKQRSAILIVVSLLVGFVAGLLTNAQPWARPTTVSTTLPPKKITPTPIDSSLQFEVRYVLDGDTIELTSGDRVRYEGINAPEHGQRWSGQATLFNKKLVEGKTVQLELDRTTRDVYDRVLAYVWVDGILVNEALLEEGYAKTYFIKGEAVIKYRDRFLEAEKHAKDAQRGLWTPVP
jgi:endonuclease YncB( thermonuclease family)